MPNVYSHALVLANYEALGFLDSTSHPAYKYSTSRSARKQRKPSSRQVPAAESKSNNVPKADADIPRHSLDYNMLARSPCPLLSTDFSPQPLTRQRSADTVKVTDTATPPSTHHHREQSDATTIRSFRSGSTGSLPAPSIITQIYAPLRPSSPSQSSRHTPSPPSSPSTSLRRASCPSPASHYESRSTPSPTTYIASTPKGRKTRLVILEEDSAEDQPTDDVGASSPVRSSATTIIAEPSLDLDRLDGFTGQTGSNGRTSRETYRTSRSLMGTTTNRMYLDFTHSDPPTPRSSIEVPAIAVPPPRSISPASLTTVSESIADNDTELYFGSADDSSEEEYTEDEDPTSSSSPTSLEDSLDNTSPWGNPRLASASVRHPEDIPTARATRNSQSANSSIRGSSTDDAAPPPIARVRRVDFETLTESPPPTRRSSNLSRRLGALKPSFPSSVKRTFSHGAGVPAHLRHSVSSAVVRKIRKPKPKDLISGSISYDQAVQATAPIMTANAAALLPPPSKALQESLLLSKHPAKLKKFGLEAQNHLVARSVPYERAAMSLPPVPTTEVAKLLPPSSRELQARLRKKPGKGWGNGGEDVGAWNGAVGKEREQMKSRAVPMRVPYARALRAQVPATLGEREDVERPARW